MSEDATFGGVDEEKATRWQMGTPRVVMFSRKKSNLNPMGRLARSSSQTSIE